MRTNDEIAKLIAECLKPPVPAPQSMSREAQLEEGCRDILKAFEYRAREIDGDAAPTGLEAIRLRYYPHGITPSTNEQGMERLRHFVRGTLKL